MSVTEPLPDPLPAPVAEPSPVDPPTPEASAAISAIDPSASGDAAADSQAISSSDAADDVAGPVVALAEAASAETPPREPGLSPAQTAVRLAELFPALFASPPKPIKLRIQVDIQTRAPGIFTKKVMSIFLSRYTTTTPYLKALVAETSRFDLDGQAAGEIAAEHKQAAVDELARRRQIVEERRAAERAARGPRRAPGHQNRALGEPASVDGAAAPTTTGEGPDHPNRPNRAEHPAHPMRPDRPPRREPARGPAQGAPNHQAQRREQGERPAGDQRGPRFPQRQDSRSNGRADNRQNNHPDARSSQPPRGGQAAQRQEAPAPREWTPADPVQRERAVLLRTWESSSLTKANFCALKRLTEAEFDAQLEQARQERSASRNA